jgi:sugar O-acyltransferase (sialic acid O-acetyltransferase NeuD family)
MKSIIYIIGAGGHAKVVARAATEGGLSPMFIDSTSNVSSDSNVIEEKKFLASPPTGLDWKLICGMGSTGSMSKRAEILARYYNLNDRFVTVISRSANVDPTAVLEPGVFVGPGGIIACNAIIRSHAIINSNVVIEHDSIVGENSHIATGAVVLGGVSISENVLVGANATVLQGVSVGTNSVIGAASLCLKNIPNDGGTWVGVPAKRKR